MPTPDSALIILNPQAAGGKTGRWIAPIRSWLNEYHPNSVLIETQARAHAEQLAAQAYLQGFRRIVAVGGDGTLQEVANGLMAVPELNRPSLGLVPAGRGNDAARGYGLSSKPLEALRHALRSDTRSVDLILARCADGTQRYCCAAGGIGFDAQVAHTMATQRRFWMRGELGYMLATLNELRRFENCQLCIRLDTPGDSTVVEQRFLFTAFANGPFYGGGMRICPDARFDDGLIDVCMVGDLTRGQALKELPGIYQARHVHHPKVRMARAASMTVDGNTDIKVHLDGEPFGHLPLHLSVAARALQIAKPG